MPTGNVPHANRFHRIWPPLPDHTARAKFASIYLR
jgi:hypothetical protein